MPPDMSRFEVHLSRLRRIRLFLCDVDGVMTNGRWDAAVAKFAS